MKMLRERSSRGEGSGGHRALLLGSLLFSALIAGCSDGDRVVDPAQQDTVTVAFQDLVSPSIVYAGTSDAILKDGPATQFRNGNFGAVSSDTIGAVRLGSAVYSRRLILRMDLSSIKNCSRVIRATLTIHTTPPEHGSVLLGAFLVSSEASDAWIEGIGGLGAGVSWTTVDGGVPWKTEGGDFDRWRLDVESAATDTTYTFTLPAHAVLGWINDPRSNHGVIILSPGPATADTGSWTTVFMREHQEARLHPRLEIAYVPG